MKKQLIIAAVAVFSSLSMQGMFVSKLRTVAKAPKSAPVGTRTYSIKTHHEKQDAVYGKMDEMAAEYGIGMRFFLDQLPASNPDSMYAYLEYVNANAKEKNKFIKRFDKFIDALTNPTETQPQQEIACDSRVKQAIETMTEKYGVGMAYFINQLPVAETNPDIMCEYLETQVKPLAQHKARNLSTLDGFITFKKRQQQK